MIWVKKQKRFIIEIFALAIILSGFLLSSVGILFAQQQQIFSKINQEWQIIQKYENILSQTNVYSQEINFYDISLEEVNNLSQQQSTYSYLFTSIQNDLQQVENSEHFNLDFHHQSIDLLRQTKQLIQQNLLFITTKYCLYSQFFEQIQLTKNLNSNFAQLQIADETTTVKNILQKNSQINENLSKIVLTLPNCFEYNENLKHEMIEVVQPILNFYQDYQNAVKLFADGIDNLQVDKVDKALSDLKISQNNVNDLDQIADLIQTNLNEIYQSHLAEQTNFNLKYQTVKQLYLETQLKTLFRSDIRQNKINYFLLANKQKNY